MVRFQSCVGDEFALIIFIFDVGIPYDGNFVKAQLLELVQENKPSPLYMAVAIANVYGHQVQYTPP
jgi:hypothetical protein